jgi:predicted component of type VI protein secretion system
MKVQLVVVRGKPEGKVIPLVGPKFKIGRGETCHLRPNSEQVSREHAEFTLTADSIMVRDLGSRNGTLVNGKALTADACRLKDRDLVQVGPLTFAVAILDAPAAGTKAAAAAPPPKTESPDEISGDDIDSWLVGPNAAAVAEAPTAVYGGETLTISAFKDASAADAKDASAADAKDASAADAKPAAASMPPSASDDEYERQPDDDQQEEEPFDDLDAEEDEALDEEESSVVDELPEEFLDPTNPLYAAKKAQKEQAKQTGPAKPSFKDTSDAASDILRRLMERRRAERSS